MYIIWNLVDLFILSKTDVFLSLVSLVTSEGFDVRHICDGILAFLLVWDLV